MNAKKSLNVTGSLLVAIFALMLLFPVSSFAQPDNFELVKYWSFAWENYKNKQYDRAVKHFWKVVELDTIKKFPKLYRYLGNSYLQLNNADSAQVVYEFGINRYPDDPYLHKMRGFLLAGREQTDESILEYEKVVELDPESIDDMMQLATLYIRADRVEVAISTYQRILELEPDNMEAQQNMSELLKSTGDIEAVIEAQEKVRAQQSENSQVRFDLGKLYYDSGEFEKAIELFNEFLQLTPGDIQAMQFVGKSYQRLDQYRKAITEFKKILDVDSQNKETMCEISGSYRELGSFASARTYANKAIAADNTYGRGWIALGEAYEGSSEKCDTGGGALKFGDKLVYELAYQKYKRAARDLEFKGEADNKLNYLTTLLPTTEDVFMHSEKSPKSECYSWIPKSEFGNGYWAALNRRLGK